MTSSGIFKRRLRARKRGRAAARAMRAPHGKRLRRQGRMTVSVHPLFVLFGLFFFLRGELFLFLVCTAAALIHEFGHALYAARIGCRLDRILLLPCGAVVQGDIEGISLADEIRLALAGPAVNAACAVLFVALWWLFPDTYAFTDTAAYMSAGLCVINLLPAYPLDGGRVLYCVVARFRGALAARKVCVVCSLIVAAAVLALFVLSCLAAVNFSLLFFALFILFGTFGGKDCRYTRLMPDFARTLARGAEVKRVALAESCTVKRALSFLERGKQIEFAVYDGEGELACVLSEREFFAILQRADIYSPIGTYINGGF